MNNSLLNNTGERMIPEISSPDTFWEHIYRYKFTIPYLRAKRVLDIASGEGYGTSAMRNAGAKSVIGIDISKDACINAWKKYKIDSSVASAENIPLPDNSIDIIVSFETIEHLTNPDKFLQETRRILAKNGKMIISTPNKVVFKARSFNPFHLNEMDGSEFYSMLSTYYSKIQMFGQLPIAHDLLGRNALCSQTIPSNRIKGTWRLNKLRRKILKKISGADIYDARVNIEKVILERDGLISKSLNPYYVRPIISQQEEYSFFIALIHKL